MFTWHDNSQNPEIVIVSAVSVCVVVADFD
jgi:hypothetical protein